MLATDAGQPHRQRSCAEFAEVESEGACDGEETMGGTETYFGAQGICLCEWSDKGEVCDEQGGRCLRRVFVKSIVFGISASGIQFGQKC